MMAAPISSPLLPLYLPWTNSGTPFTHVWGGEIGVNDVSQAYKEATKLRIELTTLGLWVRQTHTDRFPSGPMLTYSVNLKWVNIKRRRGRTRTKLTWEQKQEQEQEQDQDERWMFDWKEHNKSKWKQVYHFLYKYVVHLNSVFVREHLYSEGTFFFVYIIWKDPFNINANAKL